MENSKLINYPNRILQFLYFSLILFTPLIMTSITSELFEFNKMIFIYLITVLIGFFWLWKMILNNKIIIKKTALDIPIILFLLSQVLSTIFSIDVHTSVFGYYGRFNGGLLSIIVYIFLYYGFVSNVVEFAPNFITKFFKLSIISSFLVILWGLPGKFGYDISCLIFTGQFNNSCWTNQFRPAERLFSTLGQPNWLGAYLAINFFIAVYFYITNSEKKYLILNTAYLILNFATILFTRSRSALLAVILGLGLLFSYLFFKYSRLIKKLNLFLLLLLILVLFFKTGIANVDKIITLKTYINLFTKPKNRQTKKSSGVQPATSSSFPSDVTESGDIRRIVWKGAVDLGKNYPLFGTGVETFAYSYYFVRPKEHNLTSEWDYLYNKAHNEYLNYFATTGFIGLMSYLFLISATIKYGWINIKYQKSNIKNKNQNLKLENTQIKNHQLLITCLLLTYITILITNFFGFSTTTINLFFYLIPALIFVISSNQQPITSNQQLTVIKLFRSQKIYFFILLTSSLYLLFSIFRYWLADVNYAKGDNYYKIGSYQEAANYLDKAYKLKYEHMYEDKLSYVLANLAFISAYQKQNETAEKLRNLSNYYNQKSLKASPKNVLYWKTKAKNDYLFYQIDQNQVSIEKGIQALKTAEELAPTDPKIPYSLAIFYSLLVDETKDLSKKNKYQQLSIGEINSAIDLKSNDRSFYLLKGQLLKKFGEREEARKTFQYIIDKLNPQDSEAASELKNL